MSLPVRTRISTKLVLLLGGALLLQALLSGLLITRWISGRALQRHQTELEEQARVLLPALRDSLATWSSPAPTIIRQAEQKQRMNLGLGRLQAMSVVWLDAKGNTFGAGYLPLDSRFIAIKQDIEHGLAAEVVMANARNLGLPLVAESGPHGWLLLSGQNTDLDFWNPANHLLIFCLFLSAGLIGALLVLLLLRPLLKRFTRFSSAFHQLGSGELYHRLPAMGNDELGMLGREFNRMAERLAIMRNELDHSDRMRRRMISDVSHELGAPLTNIRGNLERLSLAEGLDGRQRSSIALCIDQAIRMSHLVDDLLDLARLDEAGLTLQRKELDLRAVAEGEIAAVELACLQADIEVRWRCAGGDFLLDGDEARIAQILRNLLRNAVQALESSQQENRWLEIRLLREPGWLTIEVGDNGAGIRGEDLDHLFDRYYRPHHRRSSGSGLGLCISRRLAELHAGSLTARSEGLGKGACFSLRLPAGDEASQE